MSWNNMYNQGNFGGRSHGNYRGGFNPQLNSPGVYGRGGTNYRGGYRQGHDMYVNDEVVGGGGGYQRKAPPAHSGNNYSNYGQASPMFNPPQAHSYGGFPGYGHYGYGGYQHWNDYNQAYGSPTTRRNQSQHRSSSEDERPREQKEKEEKIKSSDQVEDSGSETQADPIPEKEEAPIPMIRSQEKYEPDPHSNKDSGNGQSLSSTNNRRKQYTPQKVPVGPGGNTMNIITQKGLILENELESNPSKSTAAAKNLSMELGTEEASPKDTKESTGVNKQVQEEPKEESDEMKPSPLKRPVLRTEVKKDESESDIDSEGPGSNNKARRADGALPSGGVDDGGGEADRKEEKLTSSEGDRADKESEDEAVKNKQIVRKKRAVRAESKMEESDSDLEAASGGTPNKVTPTKPRFTSPRASKNVGIITPEGTPDKPFKEERSLENPVLPQLRAEDTPQRRRSKGEMKEFPVDATAKAPKPATVESTTEGKEEEKPTPEFETPRRGGRRKELKTPSPAKQKEAFKKVEEDLEAMFAGISTPHHQPEMPEFIPEPERKSPRSKRKSAQTAELKIRENQSEDAFNLYQPDSKPKSAKDSPTSKEPPKRQRSQPEQEEQEENVPETRNKRSAAGPKELQVNPAKSEAVKPLVPVDETAVPEGTQTPVDKVPSSPQTPESKRPRRGRGSNSDASINKGNDSEVKEVTPSPVKPVVEGVRSSRRRALSTQSSEESVPPPPPNKRARKSEQPQVSQDSDASVSTPPSGLRSSGRRREKRASQDSTNSQNPTKKDSDVASEQSSTLQTEKVEKIVEDDVSASGNKSAKEPVLEQISTTDSAQEKESSADVNLSSSVISEHSNTEKKDSINNTLDDSQAGAKKKPGPPKGKPQKEDKTKKRKKSFDEVPDTKTKKPGKAKSDWKGPYVYIEGDFRSPRVVKVVNTEVTEGNEDKKRHKRGLQDTEYRRKSANHGHTSTLSKQYDYKNVDDTWRCVFCQQMSHYRCMGDLYGPYWVPSHCLKTEIVEKRPKSKRKSLNSEPEKDEKGEAEIWFHEDCFVWVPGVYLLGSRIMGMEDAVSLCRNTKCQVCGEVGASLGCTRAGCRNAVHIPCSFDHDWETEPATFKATCPSCTQEILKSP